MPDNRKLCTCTGTCRGAEGLGEGWRCALEPPDDERSPCQPPVWRNDSERYPVAIRLGGAVNCVERHVAGELRDGLERVLGPRWQPIATAPTDGTPVLGFEPSYYQGRGGIVVALCLDGSWRDNLAWEIEPTHWMPLPTPPAKEGEHHG